MVRFLARIIGIVILANAIVNHPAQVANLASNTFATLSDAVGNAVNAAPAAPAPAPAQGVAAEVRFTENEGARPVVWDTCDVVPVLINPGKYGDEGLAFIKHGVAELAELTGVRFTVTGTTDAIPSKNWYAVGGDSGAEGFAPVIVAIVDRDDTDMLAHDAVGAAVANPSGKGDSRRLVTGAVVLAEDSLAGMRHGFKPGNSWGTALVHELGHLAGLDHAANGLMAPTLSRSMQPAYSTAVKASFAAYRPHC